MNNSELKNASPHKKFLDSEIMDKIVNDFGLETQSETEHEIKSELRFMGFSKTLVDNFFKYNSGTYVSTAQVLSFLVKENGIWQHNIQTSLTKGNQCLICGENSDHLDYKTEEYLIKRLSDDQQLETIIMKKLSKSISDESPGKLSLKDKIKSYNPEIHAAFEQTHGNKIKFNLLEKYTIKEPIDYRKEDVPNKEEIFFKNEEEKESTGSFNTNPLASLLTNIVKDETKQIAGGKLIKLAKEAPCEICLLDETEFFSLECNHRFCRLCWQDFIVNKIRNGQIDGITCMKFECPSQLEEDVIKEFTDTDLFTKYQKFKQNKEIMLSKDRKFCPVPNCGSYACLTEEELKQNNDLKYVKCEGNQHEFCYICSNKWHGKVKCIKFLDKDFINLTKSNKIKQCPNCNAWTEKNDGCNHMTCITCRYQWCWICHGRYYGGHYSLGPCIGLQFAKDNCCTRLYSSVILRVLIKVFFFFLFGVLCYLAVPLALALGPAVGFVLLNYDNFRNFDFGGSRCLDRTIVSFFGFFPMVLLALIISPLIITIILTLFFTVSLPVALLALFINNRSMKGSLLSQVSVYISIFLAGLVFQPLFDAIFLALFALIYALSPIIFQIVTRYII